MKTSDETLSRALRAAVEEARGCTLGAPATYIPELANAPLDITTVALSLGDGSVISAGEAGHTFTLQSSAKLLVLAGLLEERGEEEVFSVVGKEPSGTSFSSIARLDTHGPRPANPLVNAGAIALCSLLRGNLEDKLGWLEEWATRLYGSKLAVSSRVLASERRTGDRNRALAYLLKSSGAIQGDVDEVLEVYFSLCSIEATVEDACRLPGVLAFGGVSRATGRRVLSPRTVSCVVSLMATCGMYDESGAYLLATGLPAKSGVSGIVVAVAREHAGIAVFSPRINDKGGSVRGHRMLAHLSTALGWHFALSGA